MWKLREIVGKERRVHKTENDLFEKGTKDCLIRIGLRIEFRECTWTIPIDLPFDIIIADGAIFHQRLCLSTKGLIAEYAILEVLVCAAAIIGRG